MTETYGPEIMVDCKWPAWLEKGEYRIVQAKNKYGDWLDIKDNAKFRFWAWEYISAIRLPADHWANAVIEQGYWPWAGGDTAPDDWDGGDVLLRDGDTCRSDYVNSWIHLYCDCVGDIIGYKRKVGPSVILTHVEVEELAVELDALREWKANAIAKYPDLAPDPYLKRAQELVASEAMKTGTQYYDDDADSLVIRAIMRALKEGMPTPCTLTPEELAQWRLEQARRVAADACELAGLGVSAKDVRFGLRDGWANVQSALAILNEYNITPETVK